MGSLQVVGHDILNIFDIDPSSELSSFLQHAHSQRSCPGYSPTYLNHFILLPLAKQLFGVESWNQRPSKDVFLIDMTRGSTMIMLGAFVNRCNHEVSYATEINLRICCKQTPIFCSIFNFSKVHSL